jgi:hypothetical protein
MLHRYSDAIENVVQRISYDAKSLCWRIPRHRVDSISDEDDFTSRLATKIESSLKNLNVGGLRWSAVTHRLTSHGPSTEERRFGADLGLVITASGRHVNFSKGFLIQAKLSRREHPDGLPQMTPDARLKRQCTDMLSVTSDSYVWVYGENGIRVLRAGSVLAADDRVSDDIKEQTFPGFFRSALYSWSGDYKLPATDSHTLAALQREYRFRHALLITSTDG